MLRQLVFFAICTFVSVSSAADREVICAKYETQQGWSQGYKVEATILKGTELNQATKTFDYSAFSTYVVIFWDKDEASIIELDFPYLSAIGQNGKDQQGRRWEVSKGGLCI